MVKEVSVKIRVDGKEIQVTPQYYADLIVSAMNNLGYNVPNC